MTPTNADSGRRKSVDADAIRKMVADSLGPEGDFCVQTMTNGKSDLRHFYTRDPEKVVAFCEKWSVAGRATFFCVGTVRGKRHRKEDVVSTSLISVDIDLKDIDLTAEEVVPRLLDLERPPTRIHRSGNGIHAYWVLAAPARPGEATEAIRKKLARALGGDLSPTHDAAMMRMPGTWNTKQPEWRPVVVIPHEGDRYDLEDLVEWDPPVVILQKGKAAADPFTQLAQVQGFEQPVDVEARLEAMAYKGLGEAAIHPTQLSVTAALMGRGWEVEDIVARVLERTKEVAGKHGAAWNWGAEERVIRAMCTDFEPKMKKKPEGSKVTKDSPKKDLHIAIGEVVLGGLEAEGKAILFTGGQAWHYGDDRWQMIPPLEEKDWLDRLIQKACEACGVASKNALVNEVRGWIRRQGGLHFPAVDWDGHGKVATRSGLLDPATGELIPLAPEHRVTRWIDCDYDPEARCPWWEQMLADAFPEQPDEIGLVQELLGTFLVESRPRAIRRAVVFLGASNTGKTSLIRVMSKFLSPEENATGFDMLENAHGLMPFLDPYPWVQHEAFEQGRWHLSAKTKAILSADPIQVNIKGGKLLTSVFKQAAIWGTNVPPQFREDSKAMQNRIVIVQLLREFGEHPVGAALEAQRQGFDSPADLVLAGERSGILNWAIEGLRRILQRGYFVLPELSVEAARQARNDSNIVAGFLEDCVEVDPEWQVTNPDFVAAWTSWWRENKGRDQSKTPGAEAIKKALNALGDPRIGERKAKSHRYITGIKLNEEGLDLWQSFANIRFTNGEGTRLSSLSTEVNKPMAEPRPTVKFKVVERGTVTARNRPPGPGQPSPGSGRGDGKGTGEGR